MKQLTLVLSFSVLSLYACASDQKRAPTAEAVAEGETLSPAPPVAPPSTSTASPSAATEPSAASAPSEAAPAKEPLSEAQIAKVGDLVNTAEIEQGKLAQRKAKGAAVKKLADKMVKHHGEALREQAKLAKKLNITPADSPASATLKADGEKTLESLKGADPASFDAAYVNSQVEGHQKVLDLIDSQLRPAAKTPEVVDALRKGRAAVEQHLSEARALQAK